LLFFLGFGDSPSTLEYACEEKLGALLFVCCCSFVLNEFKDFPFKSLINKLRELAIYVTVSADFS